MIRKLRVGNLLGIAVTTMKDRFGEFELGGRIRFFKSFWKSLTSDKFILDTLDGLKLNFVDDSMSRHEKFPHFSDSVNYMGA